MNKLSGIVIVARASSDRHGAHTISILTPQNFSILLLEAFCRVNRESFLHFTIAIPVIISHHVGANFRFDSLLCRHSEFVRV